MRRHILMTFILGLVPCLVFAQAKDEHHGQGYVFVAPGGISGAGITSSALHFGGGGEAIFYKGLGVGAELGYLAPTAGLGAGIGVFSVNGSYHFLPKKDRKLAPFVTGGYSLGFRSGTINMYNFGAGVHYWFSRRVGLRLEYRDQIWPGGGGPMFHHWGFRVGVAFR